MVRIPCRASSCSSAIRIRTGFIRYPVGRVFRRHLRHAPTEACAKSCSNVTSFVRGGDSAVIQPGCKVRARFTHARRLRPCLPIGDNMASAWFGDSDISDAAAVRWVPRRRRVTAQITDTTVISRAPVPLAGLAPRVLIIKRRLRMERSHRRSLEEECCMRKLLIALVGILAAAAPAAAQDYKPVDINFGFGWTFPTTDFKNSFDAGWNGTVGATFNLNAKLGVEAEYMYTRMNGPDKTISVISQPIVGAVTNGLIESNHQMHVGSFNLVYRSVNQDRPVNGYVIGGGGIYHRVVQLTSPSVGYTTVCDPYWYVCYPTAVAI